MVSIIIIVLLVVYFVVSKGYHTNKVQKIDVPQFAAQRDQYNDQLKTDDVINFELGITLEEYILNITTSLQPQSREYPFGYALTFGPGTLEEQQVQNYQRHFLNALRALRETGRAPRMNYHLTLYTNIIALDMFKASGNDWPFASNDDPLTINRSFDLCLAVGKTDATKRTNLFVNLQDDPIDFALDFIDALITNGCMNSTAPFVVSPNIVLQENSNSTETHANQILLHNMGYYWDAYLIEPNHSETWPGQLQFYKETFDKYNRIYFEDGHEIKRISYKGLRYNGVCAIYDHGGMCSIMAALEVIGPLPTFEAMKEQTSKWLQHAYKIGRDVTAQIESVDKVVEVPWQNSNFDRAWNDVIANPILPPLSNDDMVKHMEDTTWTLVDDAIKEIEDSEWHGEANNDVNYLQNSIVDDGLNYFEEGRLMQDDDEESEDDEEISSTNITLFDDLMGEIGEVDKLGDLMGAP